MAFKFNDDYLIEEEEKNKNEGFGFKGLGNEKSKTQSKNDVNSGEASSINEVLASGKDSPYGLSEPFAKRVKAFNDRIDMRREARTKKLVGGDDSIKSKFTPTAEEGSKLYEKNLKLQNKLNKRFPQPVSTGGSTVTNSNINNAPSSVIRNVSGAAEIDALKRIKATESNMSQEKANKILEEYKGYTPGEYTVEEVVDSYNKTRKYE